MKKQPPLIVICGPTASGKSSWAIKLAQDFSQKSKKIEIISADSRALYQEMDIGTAKVSPLEMKKVPHHLINIIPPSQEFNVALFQQKSLAIIKKIHQKNNIPFLVGGTGLYLKSITANLKIPSVSPCSEIRKKLEKEIKEKGSQYLWQQLLQLDPQAQKFVSSQNPRRIIRALEVCLQTQKPFSQLRNQGEKKFNLLQIGLKIEREKLYQRIDQRVEKMVKQGLVQETKELLKKYSFSSPGLQTIAYQEIIAHLQGKISLKEAIDLIKRNTRRYARRQITWFKKEKDIKWVENYSSAKNLIKSFLKNS
jgi:tRNA dimethylallyltransferase